MFCCVCPKEAGEWSVTMAVEAELRLGLRVQGLGFIVYGLGHELKTIYPHVSIGPYVPSSVPIYPCIYKSTPNPEALKVPNLKTLNPES